MPRTTGRTLALLELLQSRREWSGRELRERLEVSARTLRRDVEDLRGLGYGIEASPGVGGGYRLGPGAALPPLALSADEAVAIAVGLRAAAASVVTGMEDAAVRALAKLEGSLSPSTSRQIAQVERAMVRLGPARDDIDITVLTDLARAIAEQRRLHLRYRPRGAPAAERTVEPHRIVHTSERWYLVAWDVGREAWRTLRVDRIEASRMGREPSTPRALPDDELRVLTSRSISTAPYPVQARLRMHAGADEVRRAFGPTVAEVADAADGTSILTAGANRAEEIALYLGLGGIGYEVVEGDELRAALHRLAAEMTAAAGPPASPAGVRAGG